MKTPIWGAGATDGLSAIVKKARQLDASRSTGRQIWSVSVCEKPEVSCAVQPDRAQIDPPIAEKQVIVFAF